MENFPNKPSIVNSLLIDFDAIIDYKIGLVRIYQGIPDDEIPDMVNRDFIRSSLSYLKVQHVTSVVDILDRLYTSPIEDKEKFITSLINNEDFAASVYMNSPITAVDKIIRIYQQNQYIRFNIRCDNSSQVNVIRSRLGSEIVKKTIITPREDVELDKYGRIVIGYIQDSDKFSNPIMKDFLVLNYRENFEIGDSRALLTDYIIKVGDINKFGVVDSYTFDVQING